MDTLELIGTEDAADLLGYTRGAILAAVNDGRLTPLATLGRRRTYVFSREQIETYGRGIGRYE